RHILAFREEFRYGFLQFGMCEAGSNLEEWFQREPPERYSLVRDVEVLPVNYFIAIKEDVDIDYARAPFLIADPAHGTFYRCDVLMHHLCIHAGLRLDHLFEEDGLVGDPPGFGFVDR